MVQSESSRRLRHARVEQGVKAEALSFLNLIVSRPGCYLIEPQPAGQDTSNNIF